MSENKEPDPYTYWVFCKCGKTFGGDFDKMGDAIDGLWYAVHQHKKDCNQRITRAFVNDNYMDEKVFEW